MLTGKAIIRDERKMVVSYIYDATRRGAKYSFNGRNWLNQGEFAEALLSYHLLGTLAKDANTSFDKGSDIELGETGISVKSSKATLTSVKLGGLTMEDKLADYFSRTASNLWAWVVVLDDSFTTYYMDKETFTEFTMTFASLQNDVIRYKTSSGKMLQWLEERAGE